MLTKTTFATIFTGFHIALQIVELDSSNEFEMPDEIRNNGNNQQQVVQPLVGLRLKDIQRPVIAASLHRIRLREGARNYEFKTVKFSMLPAFHGLTNGDPLSFIRKFYSVVQTFSLSGVSEDDLRMRCFPYYLKDCAKSWLLNLPKGSLRIWKDVYNIFMTK